MDHWVAGADLDILYTLAPFILMTTPRDMYGQPCCKEA